MNFSDFSTLVSAKRQENPIWFLLDSDSCALDEDIESAESSLGVKLPSEYVAFLKRYGGGLFAKASVFSLDPNSDLNVIVQNKCFEEAPLGFIAFSDNGTGDLYGFKVVEGNCLSQVHFYDHETNKWTETHYLNILDYLADVALKA